MHHTYALFLNSETKQKLLIFRKSSRDMDPLDNGWTLDDDGGFSINWMKCNPVPDEVRL